MKFRIICGHDEITVITEDGGIACIRIPEDYSPEAPRSAVTDYYQMRLTEVPESKYDSLYDYLATGKMYHHDWTEAECNSLEVIIDALAWLCVGEAQWTLSDDLFPHLFGLGRLADEDGFPQELLEKLKKEGVLIHE